MTRRFLTLVTVLALSLVACAGPATTETQPSNTAPGQTVPEAVLLSYSLAAGQSYTFEVELDQSIEMTATGDSDVMGDDDMPEEMSLRVVGTALLTYLVSEGPTADTFEINITGDFSDVTFTGTVDGEPVDPDEVPDLAQLEPVDAIIVVDSNGRVIPENSSGGLDDLFGFGDFGDFTQSGMNFTNFFGPPFGDLPVSVGDSWTETVETPGMDGESLVTEVSSSVTGTDTLDGADVFLIRTVTSSPLIEFDLAEMIIGLMESFLQLGNPSAEDLAEFEAMADQIRFAFQIDPSVTNMTTWFDQEAGLTRRSEITGVVEMAFDVAMPNDETGELATFVMNMKVDHNTRQRLVSTSGA